MICLDRVLLMKTKVLTLDLEPEDLVQATISQVFSECTDIRHVITIAHRRSTARTSLSRYP